MARLAKLYKLIFTTAIALTTSYQIFAKPIPITKIASEIRGTSQIPQIYLSSAIINVEVEFGIASWYDCPIKPQFIIDDDLNIKDYIYPVAHKTLPFGTLIKVINPKNGKKILCRVIDRGPFIPGRIIDLCSEAAKRLEINGVGNVIIKIYRRNS